MADSPTSTSGPPAGDLAGHLLAGRYRLTTRIASGGMAQVWEAEDEVLARKVAVKVLHPHLAADESFVRRFRAEAVSAARLAHPSIVSIYDTFRDQGLEAIVMELVRGITLRQRLDAKGALDVGEVLAIGAQVADALNDAHHHGLVHRDVKPANILLSSDGRVLVADFGIAKAAEGADLTSEGLMVGTAKYVAPEQVEGGPVDGRTDLYSLGVVLYESLCGRPPFLANTDAATALARLHTPPLKLRQMRAGIPKPVEDVVLRAMARQPDQRYPDAASFRAALVAAGANPAATPELTPPPRPLPAPGPPPADGGTPRNGTEAEDEPSFVQSERDWLVPAILVIVIAVALGVAGVLIGSTSTGHDIIDKVRGKDTKAATTTKVGELKLSEAIAFDPVANDGEHDDEARLAIDGDGATAWRTSTYQDPETVGGKGGVGLIVRLDGSADVDEVVMTSAERGWNASIYTAEGDPPTDLAGWGAPVQQVDDVQKDDTTFDLGGKRADAVLIWFTRLDPDAKKVTVSEVKVTGKKVA